MLTIPRLLTRRTVVTYASVLAACAVGATAMLPASANATRLNNRIVPFESIAGVNVKSSFATVEHKLGKPSTAFHYHGKLNTLYYDNVGLIFSITKSKHATEYSLQATSARYRTPKGLHVGSSVKTLKRDYHVTSCTKLGCTVQDTHDSDRNMTVIFKHGKVDGIANYLFVDR